MAKQEWQWLRPEDVPHRMTDNPHEMLGKYLTGDVFRTWTEDFIDEDTGETVPVERHENVMEYKDEPLNRDDISKLEFYIQSDELEGVDVADVPIRILKREEPRSAYPFSVTFMSGLDHFVYFVEATTIEDAIKISMDFGSMYRQITSFTPTKVARISAKLIQDTDPCIPKAEQIENPIVEDKQYYKVTARLTWYDDAFQKRHDDDYDFIINSDDVGEAKVRTARYVRELWKGYLEGPENKDNSYCIRKAAPIKVDAVVPLKYSALYHPELKKFIKE